MNRVHTATQLVREMDSLSVQGLEKLDNLWNRDRILNEYLTALCITDFWHFRQYGVYWNARGHYDSPLYGPEGTAGFLQSWKREDGTHIRLKFLIMFREGCKTQEAIAWDCWNFVRDPNTRLLIRAFADDKAHEINMGLRNTLKSPHFQRRFPWVKPAVKSNGTEILWKEDRFILDREDVSVRSPSCEACGITASPTGGHFQRRHGDDLEIDRNANSELLLAKMIECFKNDDNLMVAGSQSLICGTPWAKDGLINGVNKNKGDFKDHDYDVFSMPCTVKVFDAPFDIHEPILLDDRVTFRCAGAGFPTAEANLVGCQARATFYSSAAKDNVTELREIVWNDGEHVRVNRTYSPILRQPLVLSCGPDKPAAMNRHTLDSVDDVPDSHASKDDSFEVRIARKSLPAAKRTQGTIVYSAQMDLNPVDPSSVVFHEDDIVWVRRDELPHEHRRFYQAMDLATAKKTASSSAIVTGFHHPTGLYLTHCTYANQMKPMDILLALFLNAVRVKDMDGFLTNTFHEAANVERTLLADVAHIQSDPFKFFYDRGERYMDAADINFKGIGTLTLRLRELSRGGNESKTARLSGMQPFVEAKRLHIVEDIQHRDTIVEQFTTFTLASEEMFDLLECIADIVREGRPPVVPKQEQPDPGREFKRRQNEAIQRLQMKRHLAWVGARIR